MSIDTAFQKFYDNIELGVLPEGRIADAWTRLQAFLVKQYSVSAASVFLQGSYANETTIKPVDASSEYDLDVVVIGASATDTANGALEHLEAVLKDDADYAQRLESKKPCVRLRYADSDSGRFHVDVVVARERSTAPLEIPFRDDGWHDTNPEGYRDWCLAQGPRFTRTVRMLKRWRDENQDERRGIKSIVLQVLVGLNIEPGEDAASIAGTLANIKASLADHPNSPPVIPNPSLPSENLADRWSDSHYTNFLTELGKAVDIAARALAAGSSDDAFELWGDLLGDAFPEGPGHTVERAAPAPPPKPVHAPRIQTAPRERYG